MQSKYFLESDLRQAMRLVAECRELGDDLYQWRAHLMAGLARLVKADAVLHLAIEGLKSQELPVWTSGMIWSVRTGLQLEGWQPLVAGFGLPLETESFAPIRSRLSVGLSLTVVGPAMLTNGEWDTSSEKPSLPRAMSAEPLLQSFYVVSGDSDLVDGIFLRRAMQREAFSERDMRVVYAVHTEISRWIGGPLISYKEQHPARLPLRVRQVLQCLLQGDTDKQIAQRLGISPYTVNQYTKIIYEYFTVASRTELLARWLRRGWTVNARVWDPPADCQT